MAYTITRSDGTVLTTVADGTINTTTSSLALPGKNYSGYGQYQNINAIRQVENFASNTPPKYPLKGQLWYNTTDNTLRLCPADGTTTASSWLVMSTSTAAGNSLLGNLVVSGNISTENITSNNITGQSGTFSVINATTQLNAASANLVSANVGTLNTTLITTGSPSAPGTLIGDWTVNNSIYIANTSGGTSNAMMNISGVYASAYHYSNGAPFITYTNANVYEYLNGSNAVVRFNGNIAPTSIQATSGTIGTFTSTTATIANATMSSANVTTINTDVLTANTVTISTLGVNTLTANSGFLTNLSATNLSGTGATYSTVSATTRVTSPIGNLTTINSTTINNTGSTSTGNLAVGTNTSTVNLNASNVTATTGAITTVNSTTVNTQNMNAVYAGATHLTGVNDITAGGSGGVFYGIWTLGTGARLQATYADFAERYASDMEYEPGTVVQLGGTHEITAAIDDASNDVFGVVTTNPAHVLNAGAGDDSTHPAIALIGRTPVKVIGMVSKFARLVSAGDGMARQAHPSEITAFNVIGRSLENKTDIGVGLVEAVVKIS